MNKTDKKPGNRTVIDAHGGTYELKHKLGEGGQGMVCTTQYPNVLVKVSKRPSSDPRTQSWHSHIQWISRQALEGLHIAAPRALIVKPRLGYVMELMDGLESLKPILDQSLQAMQAGDGLKGFMVSGGVSRRVRLLARLARSLASLHGRGLAYGDLSPANIFVSRSHEHQEVWLIDCDNICVLSREGEREIHTPGYGAPEIMRSDSGINSLTDSWSFGVMAFQLLTLIHPLEGDMVADWEPELVEKVALRGDLPWVDHPTDDRNRTSRGLPREQVLTLRLRDCFEQCFNAGLNDPGARPSMATWAEAFEAAAMLLVDCDVEEGCGSSFLFNPRRQCPFCDHIQAPERFLLMHHYIYAPLDELGEGAKAKDQWARTSDLQLLALDKTVELHSSPVGSCTYTESPVVARLELKDEGLWIEPLSSLILTLQREGGIKAERVKQRMLLKAVWKKDHRMILHLGDPEKLHATWRFHW